MAMTRVGFFREPHRDSALPSLRDAVQEVAQDDEAKTVAYLQSGVLLVASPGPSFDVLSDRREVAGAQHLLGDGVWCWPGDLAYYVEKYHVRLPEAFVEHMRSRSWRPPTEEDVPADAWPSAG